jgi:hypothetical protein
MLPALYLLVLSVISEAAGTQEEGEHAEPRYFDIYLTIGVNDTMKAKGKTVTIHQVNREATLTDIKRVIRERSYDGEQPAVGAGLYWLRKKGQDCFELKTSDDLEKAKMEHSTKDGVRDLRLAVASVKKAP